MPPDLSQFLIGLTIALEVPLKRPYLLAIGLVLFFVIFFSSSQSRNDGAKTAAQFRARLSLGCLALALTAIVSIGSVINPYAIFPWEAIQPIILTSRVDKLKMLDAYSSPPEVLILGSSRSFTMPPSMVESATGLSTFNASVQGGTARDFIGILNYYSKTEETDPQYVIAAVSTEQFIVHDNEIKVEPADPLGPYMDSPTQPLSRVRLLAGNLFSSQAITASLASLRIALTGRTPPYYSFDPDGLGRFRRTYTLEEAVRVYLNGPWSPSVFQRSTLDNVQLDYLRAFVQKCSQRGIELIIYVPPFQPTAQEAYDENSNLPELHRELIAELETLSSKYDFLLYDFGDISSFGGNSEMFVDAVHPSEEGSRAMLKVILDGWPHK